jgi:hypothetical protein
MEKTGNACRICGGGGGGPLGHRPLLTLGRREDNIKMDLMEISCVTGKWMNLAQDRVQWRVLVLVVLNLQTLLPDQSVTLINYMSRIA